LQDKPNFRASTALSQLTVLDLTRVRAGPTCARQFADWGANVIKIEAPERLEGGDPIGGARHSGDFQNLHRNKRSITIDFKNEAGRALLLRLAKKADVVIENFRPDVKRRLKIDYPDLKAVNPRIIYASISAYGQTGPYETWPGFDQIAQGMGGLMSVTGLPGQGPVRAGAAVADMTAGLFAALGIMTALLEREKSGEGQYVETSLLAAQIFLLDFQAARWLIDGEVPLQAGNNHPTSTPTGVFPTLDGEVNIAAAGDRLYRRMCKAIGRPDLADHSDFVDTTMRTRNRDALNEIVAGYTRTQTSAALTEALTRAGVPCGPIYRIDETFNDPQVKHLGIARTVEHPGRGAMGVVGQPLTLSRAPQPGTLRMPTPERGEHSDALLAELGYDREAIRQLRAGNVI
jgi:formyl-CoA transferase